MRQRRDRRDIPSAGGPVQTGVVQDIVASGKNMLVFVHGFANSFLNSITRAAYNREWLAASGINAADRPSSPSAGRLWVS